MSKKIFTAVMLIGAYVVCQAIADVSATKMVSLGGIVLPAGSLIFAATFTLRDLVHKRLGLAWARAAIIVAAVLNIVQAVYLGWVATLQAPAFYAFAEAWGSIFAIVPAITIGSIIAEFISEMTDTEVYRWWTDNLKAPQWTRVVVSNMVSLPIDSFVFALLAFVLLPPLFGGEALPFSAAWAIVGGQIVWKAIISVISIPLIYTIKDKPMTGVLVVE